MGTIDTKRLEKALLVLCDEAYVTSKEQWTWFSDNEPGSGVLGTLEKVSAEEASRDISGAGHATIAGHTNHLRFALNLANRAYGGEDVYTDADWESSWEVRTVDEAAWSNLVAELRKEYEAFRSAIAGGLPWENDLVLTGTIGQIAHGAWHLGALRRSLELLR